MNNICITAGYDAMLSLMEQSGAQVWVYVIQEHKYYVCHKGEMLPTPYDLDGICTRVTEEESDFVREDYALLTTGSVDTLQRHYHILWNEQQAPQYTQVDYRVGRDEQGNPLYFTTVMTPVTKAMSQRQLTSMLKQVDTDRAKLQRYTKLLEILHRDYSISIWMYDVEKDIVLCDGEPTAGLPSQMKLEEFIGMSIIDNQELLKELAVRVRAREDFETNVLLQFYAPEDGRVRHIRAFITAIRGVGGMVVRYGLVCVDITEMHHLMEMLRMSQTIGEIGSWSMNIKTGNIRWTEKLYEIFEVPPTEKPTIELTRTRIHPDDLEMFDNAVANIREDTTGVEVNLRLVMPSGRVKNAFLKYVTPVDGIKWHYHHAYGVVMDTTNLVQLHEKTTRSENMLNNVINTIPSMMRILDIDNNWRVFMANKQFAEFVGYKEAKDIIGLNHYDFFPPEMAKAWEKSLEDALPYTSEHPYLKEEAVTLKNGKVVYIQSKRFSYWIDGHRYLFATSEDVTDLTLAKMKAEESEHLKDTFYANMSHDIRTPLNAIAGFSELLAVTDDPAERLEYVELIQQSNKQAMALFNDILDYSRLKSGTTVLRKTTFDIEEFMQGIYKFYLPEFAKLPIALRFVSPGKPYEITQDQKCLHQVVTNYVNNAIKYTSKGSVTIGYKINGQELYIYVADTGVGIPEEGCELVFNRFEKLSSYIQGTGLGLSICKAIVKAMGGHVGVDSEVGVGSTFWVRLPLTAK